MCDHELVSGGLHLTRARLVVAHMICDICGQRLQRLQAQTAEARSARCAHPILTIAGDRVVPVLPALPVTIPVDP